MIIGGKHGMCMGMDVNPKNISILVAYNMELSIRYKNGEKLTVLYSCRSDLVDDYNNLKSQTDDLFFSCIFE